MSYDDPYYEYDQAYYDEDYGYHDEAFDNRARTLRRGAIAAALIAVLAACSCVSCLVGAGLGLLLVGGGGAAAPASAEALSPPLPAEPAASPDIQPASPDPAVAPAPAPAPPPPGTSRSQPYPRGQVVPLPGWELQVMQVLRGEQAWQALQVTNPSNPPPPGAMEYLLVRLHVRSTHTDGAELSISAADFLVTGDRRIAYSIAPVLAPEPGFEAELLAGEESEGWVAYLVGQGEGNLILVFEEISSMDASQRRYVALDEGAAVPIPPELAGITPTDLGREIGNRASLGASVTTENWEIALLQVVRGGAAWAMVQSADEFNQPPAPGMEYLAVEARARFIGSTDQTGKIDAFSFKTTGDASVLYDPPGLVTPEPALDVILFPGGQYDGWLVFEAAQGEAGLSALFQPPSDSDGAERRYLSLEP